MRYIKNLIRCQIAFLAQLVEHVIYTGSFSVINGCLCSSGGRARWRCKLQPYYMCTSLKSATRSVVQVHPQARNLKVVGSNPTEGSKYIRRYEVKYNF